MRLQQAAFRRLYSSGQPVTAEQLAADLEIEVEQAETTIAAMLAQGRIRVGDGGEVVGAQGLSVTPDRHEMWVGDRRFWTWCAMDAAGILGALGRSGCLRSRSPHSGAPLEVVFTDGRPEPTPAVVFIAEFSDCGSIYDEWCSQLNLFEDAAAATAWREASAAAGSWVAIGELAETAADRWRPTTAGLG